MKTFQPLMFGNRDGKAIIRIEDGEVEIHGRDLSRLWFALAQVMDKADLQIAESDARLRLERMP
ncbi:MAG: hypothetical protein AB7L09_02150 [Nitrospira sp.]